MNKERPYEPCNGQENPTSERKDPMEKSGKWTALRQKWANSVAGKFYKNYRFFINIACFTFLLVVLILITLQSGSRYNHSNHILNEILKKQTEVPQPLSPTNPVDDASVIAGPYSSSSKKASDIVVVDVHYQLRIISEGTSTIVVNKLISKTSPAPSGLSYNCCNTVKNVTLSGPITLPWLYYLLQNFKNVEILHVNVDAVSATWGNNDNSTLDGLTETPITFTKMKKLCVENSHQWPIFNWGFDLSMPDLKIVFVKKATFDATNFQDFQALVNGSKSSIEGIEITESYICPDCDITALQFPNIKYLKITKQVEEEDLVKLTKFRSQ